MFKENWISIGILLYFQHTFQQNTLYSWKTTMDFHIQSFLQLRTLWQSWFPAFFCIPNLNFKRQGYQLPWSDGHQTWQGKIPKYVDDFSIEASIKKGDFPLSCLIPGQYPQKRATQSKGMANRQGSTRPRPPEAVLASQKSSTKWFIPLFIGVHHPFGGAGFRNHPQYGWISLHICLYLYVFCLYIEEW